MDFTPEKYAELLTAFLSRGYRFVRFIDYLEGQSRARTVILRHDVDRGHAAALRMAKQEADLGITATYNFRYRAFDSFHHIIKEISSLGHEIGYHYEELSHCRGDREKALRLFADRLEHARKLVPLRTMAMHGSPLSRYDNRSLWSKHSYGEYGIAGEPYLDLDFTGIRYITDTGRLWNDRRFNLRDHAGLHGDGGWRNTSALIHSIQQDGLPDQLMLNVHPGRWIPFGPCWLWEWGWQWTKNRGKRLLKPFLLGHADQAL